MVSDEALQDWRGNWSRVSSLASCGKKTRLPVGSLALTTAILPKSRPYYPFEAVFFRAVFFRAVFFRAMFFRAVFFRAVFFRAVFFRAMFFRAAFFRAAFFT